MSKGISVSEQQAQWAPYDPKRLTDQIISLERVLVFGEQGSGKSHLCSALAECLRQRGQAGQCISADPGSPVFGAPGCVSLGVWGQDGWKTIRREALCTLDAGRFRLPLYQAVTRLVTDADDGPLLIDAPGLTRGIAAAELLPALVDAAQARGVIVIGDKTPPLPNELKALPCPVIHLRQAEEARPLPAAERRKQRTRLWESQAGPFACEFDLNRWTLLGTPPPLDAPGAWKGRQIAVLEQGRTLALGEVLGLNKNLLATTLDRRVKGDALLVRNAVRRSDGSLGTATPIEPGATNQSKETLPQLVEQTEAPLYSNIGKLDACLHNGVFGDPILELALRDTSRRLLFDLGEAGKLPARLAHRVSDVFISHAHFDHIGGFPWLLRARLIPLPACRIFGPPGTARHIANWIGGIHWDRIGDQAPVFTVSEVHETHLNRYRIVTGKPLVYVDTLPLSGGLLLEEPEFRVRTITLDHGIPVLAFALEQADHFNVSRDALEQLQLPGGPWLAELKQDARANRRDHQIQLPNGRWYSAGSLAERLLERTPGERLVYATDFAYTEDNRRRLVDLAAGADTLMCEASFLSEDAEQARNTQHLTAGACGRIAAEARVRRLIPFHFSRRYRSDPAAVYQEIREGFAGDLVRQPVQPPI